MYRRKYGKAYHLFCTNLKKCDDGKTIPYKLRFIDSFRFTSPSLSDLVDNLSGIFYNIECKSCMEKIKNNSEWCFVGLKIID